jgi:hypothetical protein
MADLSKFVGRKLVWTGTEFDEEEQETKRYFLFEDGAGFMMNGTDPEPTELSDAVDTLEQFLRPRLEGARNLLALEDQLKKFKPAEVKGNGSI